MSGSKPDALDRLAIPLKMVGSAGNDPAYGGLQSPANPSQLTALVPATGFEPAYKRYTTPLQSYFATLAELSSLIIFISFLASCSDNSHHSKSLQYFESNNFSSFTLSVQKAYWIK